VSDISDYTIEVVRLVLDNEHGRSITVQRDRDGLGLLELDGGDEYGRLILPPQMAVHLADAIRRAAVEMGAAA